MARASNTKGTIEIIADDPNVIKELLSYFKHTYETSLYYILPDKDPDGSNRYLSDFVGHGRWQFNITVDELGQRMNDELNKISLDKMESSAFNIVFDVVDIEYVGNVFYKSKLTLDHRKNTPLYEMEYGESDLQFIKINDENLEKYGVIIEQDERDLIDDHREM